jgi:hypothetical protein
MGHTDEVSTAAQRRGVENLLVTQMLSRFDRSGLPIDEGSVATALTPMHVGQSETPEQRERLLAGLLRTGTVFVLSSDDVPGFSDELMDLAWEPWDGLPPLPFTRIWIECGSPLEMEPVPFPFEAQQEADWWSGSWGYAIVGDESEWLVAQLQTDPVRQGGSYYPWQDDAIVDVSRITADASSHYPLPPNEDGGEAGEVSLAMEAWFAIMLVQAIDVMGSRGVAIPLPRPHRRAFERQFGVSHPAVYFVDLEAAGDEPKAGRSEREYHCRWLVRGHWRTFADGRRTWVRP